MGATGFSFLSLHHSLSGELGLLSALVTALMGMSCLRTCLGCWKPEGPPREGSGRHQGKHCQNLNS